MSYDPTNRWSATANTAIPQVGVDVGLRNYMLRVYNYMAGGLAITGIAAYLIANTSLVNLFFQVGARGVGLTGLGYVGIFAPLAFVLALSFGVQRMSLGTMQAVFWSYAAVMGISVSQILLLFTGESVARVFFITAGMFLGMSLWGYTTRTDLSRFGSFLIMGLIGIIIAGVVNIFVGSSALQFAISVIGVIVFVGLTAWDTQRIKEMYWEGDTAVIAGKKAIMGALSLYLDFVNLFMILMQLMGNRRD
jgi:FtsH-binding integral membrane protein